MTFNKNGKIETYKNENEDAWSLDENTGLLQFHHRNGKVLTTFLFKVKDSFGKWNLLGPFHQVQGSII